MTRRPNKPKKTAGQRVRGVLKVLLIFGLIGVLVGVGAFFVLYKSIDIPDPNDAFKAETTFVYYSGGKVELGTFYDDQNRESIPLTQMPQTMQDAVVAAENRTFWTDKGIDPKGILRAAFSNARGNQKQGASTITQQYVKILYLSSERSYQRKAKEAIVSLKIQSQLGKKEILEGYLNTIYFGRGAYGIQAAAQAFFDKDAKDLSLRESAVLATTLNNPSRYDPDNGRDARKDLKVRYQYVLEGMAEMGTASADQVDKAQKRLPKFPEIAAQSQYGGQRGHMLELVKNELSELGFDDTEIDGGGLRVTTTFTPQAMEAVEQGVLEQRPEGFSDKQLHIGAATVEVGTGALRGFYGGQDYLDSQLNWASAGGQAGSTMKVAALVASIKDGFSLKDTFEGDSPFVLQDGTDVENQGDTDYGSAISMITATENSVNTAFIDMTDSMEDGPQKVIDAANAMGIPPATAPSRKSPGFPNSSPGLEPFTGVALGSATVSPINVANAYATLANEGRAADAYIIDQVVDASGETVYSHKVSDREAVDPDIAADVTYALQQVVESGSGTAALALNRPVAGKTGTATNGQGEVSSAWFTGYTPQLATSVMYVRGKGNEQLQGWLPSYFGGAYPAETWTAVMRIAMEGLPVEDFPEPVYVDGEAPTDGHAPVPTAPATTQAPPPSQQPSSEEPTTEEPTTEAPPTSEPPTTAPPSPTDSCDVLTCPSPSPSSSPTGSPSPTPQNPSPSNGNSADARPEAVVERRR